MTSGDDHSECEHASHLDPNRAVTESLASRLRDLAPDQAIESDAAPSDITRELGQSGVPVDEVVDLFAATARDIVAEGGDSVTESPQNPGQEVTTQLDALFAELKRGLHHYQREPSGGVGATEPVTETDRPTRPGTQQLVEAIPMPAFLVGSDHSVLAYNDPLADLVGIEPLEAVGQDCRNTIASAAYTDNRRQQSLADKVVESPRSAHEQFDVARADLEYSSPDSVYRDTSLLRNRRGEEYDITFLATPIFDASGDLVAVLELVERSSGAFEEFPGLASVISHDIQNPLNVIQLYVQRAAEDIDDDDYERIEHNIERIEDILDQISKFVEGAGGEVHAEQLDLAEVAVMAWQSVQTEQATLETEPVDVEADPELLREILENLYRNAVIHGGSDVTVRVGPTDSGFYAEDTGTGIPHSERDRIFEHGYTSRGDGTGFGLPIVHQLAEKHGWSITVTDSAEGGARFEFETH